MSSPVARRVWSEDSVIALSTRDYNWQNIDCRQYFAAHVV